MNTLKVVQSKNEELEEKNSQILSSITYAQRIQNAVLPNTQTIQTLIPNSFILNKPKDIVSGDFYFIKQINNYKLIAVADCTGHGVPGALMSMLSIALLNDIVNNSEIMSSSQVLDELRRQIKKSLQQLGESDEQRDGLDIAFCAINIENNTLSFAGANTSLLLFRQNEPIIYQADHMPVGIYPKEEPFTEHQINLFSNDVLYLFSDGYYSQLKGDNDERYKIKRFKEFLTDIHHKSMGEQKQLLETNFDKWKGNGQQTDDVLVLGMKI
jgi:serine phosphatase RsbU (regulator of sigma subunit)